MNPKKRIPIERLNKFFSEEDFDLEIDFGREWLESDINIKVILYRVDRTESTIDDVYGEAGKGEIRFKPPVEIPVSFKMDTPTNILAVKHDILSPETPNNPGLPLFASTEIKKSDSTIESEKPKLVFSDTKGLPIAVDNDQTAYRLSKGYLKDSGTRRHLPFDQTSDSNSKSSTSDNMPKRVPKSEKAYSDFMEKLQPSQRKAIELQPILKRLIDMSIADDDKPVDISSQSAPPTVIVASDQGVKPKKKKQPSQPQPEVSSRPQRTKKVPARYRD